MNETRVLLAQHRRARSRQDRRLRAARRLPRDAQGAARDGRPAGPARARGVGPPRPRRRRLLDGQEGELHPQGRDGQVPLLQRGRVRARHLQGPAADAEEPAPAGRGLHHRLDRGRREQGLHLHPRRVRAPGRHPRRGGGRGLREGLPRRAHPRLGSQLRPGRAPRQGRVHLRRGDGAAGRARGQARQPAPQAALPREPGPLPGTDADQQRRDALQRAADHRARRGLVQAVRRRQLDRHEDRLDLGQHPATRQLRGRAGRHGARHHLRARRRSSRGARSQVLLPGRLLGAGAHEGASRPALHVRGDGRGGLDARHRRR